MAHAYNMINIAQRELQKLVGENRSRISEAKQGMICKHRPQSHRPRMQDSLVAETTQTGVPMHNLDLLTNHDIPKYREEREYGGHGRFAINDEERDMVDLESIGQIPDPSPTFVRVRDDNDFMAAINEFLVVP